MCFGGGKSAEDYYQEKKINYGPLPSLRMDAGQKDRKEQKLKDTVMRKGTAQRSLLNPYGDTNA